MTREEAVEEVLAGQAWDRCFDCQGQGTVWRADGIDLWKTCQPCKGLGSILLDRYKQACELLGKDLPTKPPNIMFIEITGETVMKGRYNPRALQKMILTNNVNPVIKAAVDLHATLPFTKKDPP